ncbi:Rapamycin-insensitive companion of mTOR, N-term-domain-containing protein [Radiomyces spectabilis]|uniref:Rapamycin-insensitive companion of mTOR, N-term-domain-containing protein n=1 Tax=Radiomyces spectabilis TaxID=64574 RepID=UPI0022209C74|nr:Rapamycin-insensitive companion of mTOR, N-term-domain-containing protein [Radiomyces spectabilis]KAI8394190.1 Rapamycin-insensitive companion of mTOR, N-term-domain-containing protein [Radiomyces spectabilis]
MDAVVPTVTTPPPPPPPPPPAKSSAMVVQKLEELLSKLNKEIKMKSGVENMLEAYFQKPDKIKEKRDLEAQLEGYNAAIESLNHQIEQIRTNEGAGLPEVALKLREHNYTGNTPFPVASSQIASRSRGKPRSNSTPNFKAKQKAAQENVSFPDDDAWPLGKRMHHIVHHLKIDEWKAVKASIVTDAVTLKESKLEKLDTLIRILKNTTDIDAYYPKKELVACLRQCVASPNREIRVVAIRALRHLVDDASDVELMMQAHMDVFIIRALARDSDIHEPEREQIIKLIRAFIEYGGIQHVHQGIVRAIVAIAEQTDSRLRNICLETLAELTVLDVAVTVRAGGLRVLMQALLDGTLNMAELLVHALVYVLDTPNRRCYLRPGVELETIIAPFTESSKGPNYEERLKNSAKVVTLLLKSWAGVFYMCANDMRAARSVVQALRLPVPETQKMVLDMFFDIFRVKLPQEYNNFLYGRQHTVQIAPSPDTEISQPMYKPGPTLGLTTTVRSDLSSVGASASDGAYIGSGRTTASNSERLKMLDHHLSIILIIFIDSDILMALVDMVKSDDIYLSRKATLLIGEILQLSTRLLPMRMGIQVQSLPKLFALASNFDDEQVRHNATAALAHIDKLTRARTRYANQAATANKGQRADNATRSQEKVHEVKLKIGYAIDDIHFRQLLMDSQVLNTKDYTKWSWDSILELLQGPLLNPRRLEEAMRGKKFIKRLLAFYLFNATKANVARYVKTGCTLLSTLLSNPDGIRYLSENKLLAQVAEALNELDPLNGDPETEPIFSKERMESTLSSGYFTLLGVFSKYKDGVRIMEKFKIFSLFYQLSELRNRDDLKMAIITNMDYTLDGHPRVLLSKIMTSGYNPIRLFATQFLGIILQQSESECNDWIIRLLVTQLYDTHLDVCQMAVNLLDEACEKPANLELLVKFRPSLGHLGEIGNPLLLRFLSTSTGFRYLNDLGYVHKEMDDWFEFRNQQYVTQLELSLARALVNTPHKKSVKPFEERVDSENDFEVLQPGDGLTPPHFYGELTKTEEGCSLLREKGHFQLFANFVRNYSVKDHDAGNLQRLKAVLWALGNIGATKNGLPFLEQEEIVKDIVYMAENSEVLSLKGTCYYVLGLIAKTHQGIELLGEFGWESMIAPNGEAEGLCVPLNLRDFLSIRNWKYTPALSDPPQLPATAKSNAIAVEILKNTGDMSNHILANEASKNLARLRQRYPDHFKRVDLYYSVCQLLGSYHFRSPVRKYVLDIFEMRFTPEQLLVLDEVAGSIGTPGTGETANTNENPTTKDEANEDVKKSNLGLDPQAKVQQEKLEARKVQLGFQIK